MYVVFNLLWTLGLTIAIEYPIVQLLWIVLKFDKGNINSKLVFIENKLILLPTLIINTLTNPAINLYAIYLRREVRLAEDRFWIIISFLEIVVFVIEGILYKYFLKTKWKNAFILSCVANFISYMLSFAL